ncbi:MAG: hypothetical protein QXS91_02350, partial [Candidatus Anstonellales archaeon]
MVNIELEQAKSMKPIQSKKAIGSIQPIEIKRRIEQGYKSKYNTAFYKFIGFINSLGNIKFSDEELHVLERLKKNLYNLYYDLENAGAFTKNGDKVHFTPLEFSKQEEMYLLDLAKTMPAYQPAYQKANLFKPIYEVTRIGANNCKHIYIIGVMHSAHFSKATCHFLHGLIDKFELDIIALESYPKDDMKCLHKRFYSEFFGYIAKKLSRKIDVADIEMRSSNKMFKYLELWCMMNGFENDLAFLIKHNGPFYLHALLGWDNTSLFYIFGNSGNSISIGYKGIYINNEVEKWKSNYLLFYGDIAFADALRKLIEIEQYRKIAVVVGAGHVKRIISSLFYDYGIGEEFKHILFNPKICIKGPDKKHK